MILKLFRNISKTFISFQYKSNLINMTFSVTTGLLPITIGTKAVDPVTGELSPIVGVRINSETNTVVPVTQSSSAHRKRKPPLGAVTTLEEEVAARKSYWRRQRQSEQELTHEEFGLSRQILFSLDSLSTQKVEAFLNASMDKANVVNESAKREVQRRSEAESEFVSILPPDVVAVLTEGDEAERKCEEAHFNAHKKYIEVVRKFVQKLAAEEERYKERLEEVQDAMNPEAEEVVKQRYEQARGRLQAELRDQILTKMETLDSDHSALEYARQRSELLTIEAKAILAGNMLVAGDYDCVLAGVYGDAELSSASSNQELVPLLKQLIALLEAGGPFMLSPDLLNIINGGDINIHGGASAGGSGGDIVIRKSTALTTQSQPTTHTPGSSQKKVKVAEAQLVQQATVAPSGSNMNSSALVDPNKFGTLAMSESDRKDRIRDLVTKQTYEAAKLENDTRKEEIDQIDGTITEFEARKQAMREDLKKDIQAKLAKAKSDAEREKLIMDHAANMAKLTDTLEKQKQNQLAELRKKLLDRRRQAKKNLHKTHLTEAKAQGLPADIVPDMTIPPHEQLDANLRNLVAQEEKLKADLNKTKAEEASKGKPLFDAEMEARLRALHIVDDHKDTLIGTMRKQAEDQERRALSLKEKLRARKERNKKRDVVDSQILNEEGKQIAQAGADAQLEADRTSEENAVIEALQLLEEVSCTYNHLIYIYQLFIKICYYEHTFECCRK